jgi:riboflavin kinase/FMN adenylyltransferase
VLVSFDPHPLEVLQPRRAPPRITSPLQRERLLEECGLDELWVIPFTGDFSKQTATEFVEGILVAGLGIREVHVGSEFRFGHGRGGSLASLAELGERFGFSAVGHRELLYEGEPISSTRVRTAVAQGEVELATELLGRPFALVGRVVRGDRLGHQLGYPTANLTPSGNLWPANGVYVSAVRRFPNGAPLPAVTNIGIRPTVDGAGERRVESHLLDFEGDLYDQQLEVDLLRRLRGERKFPSLEDLRRQIALDAQAGREYFSSRMRLQE